jgi:chemotaxis protein MotA
MDLGTVVGFSIACGFVLMAAAMSGDIMMYWDLVSVLIVFGGAFGHSMMQYNLSNALGAPKVALTTVLGKVDDAGELIEQIVGLADVARKESILALEKVTIENQYLAKSIKFMVDGYDAGVIEAILDVDIYAMKGRHGDGAEFFSTMAEACPAFGMIGTVMGLIVIMANLDDPDAIGPGLAVALVTTLYGSAASSMLFTPISQKLVFKSGEEIMTLMIIKQGVLSILGGENPRSIREKLNAFIAAE